MEEINNNNNNINSNNKIDNNNNNNFKDLIENEEDLKKINELFSPLSTPSEEFINAEVEKYIKLEEKQNNEDNNNNKNNKKKSNKIIDHNLIDGLDDLDEIIELNYKGKEIDNNSIKNDNEIKRLFQIQELQLEKEIEKEMLETYKPELDPIDVKRADNLLKEDALIRLAVEQKIITREEVILFIDYYEINAKINKAKRITIERLKKLKELMTKNIKKNDENEEEEEEEEEEENEEKNIEEDQIEKLTNQIEKSLTVQNSILSQRFDFDKLLYHPGEFLTAVDIKAAKKTDSKNNNNIVNKKIKEDNKNKIITKHTVIEDKNNKKNVNSNNNLTKIYKDIINSSNKNTGNNFYSSRKNNQNYKENKIELYDDNANPTNLLKVRSDRREMVKLRMKKKGSKLKELFKFNPKMTREENQKLRENFMKMFEIPDSYLDKQNIDPMRKSFLRKKIEEARNYYKQ